MQNDNASKNLLQEIGFNDFIGQSAAIHEVMRKIPILAVTNDTVLIIGETGVGKDICARAIHYLSKRADRPFVALNCGSLPVTLIENELFGHKRGAFTDARDTQLGLLAKADGGTLFLDEIETLDLKAQSSLLRLLDNKTYRPLGEFKEEKANVRFIAATNKKLNGLIDAKVFRADLFYRLGIPLRVPPLRDRKGDIPVLIDHFIEKYMCKYNRHVKGVCSNALKKLINYEWPGNVRELKNVIKEAVLLESGDTVTFRDFACDGVFEEIYSDFSYKQAKHRFEKKYLLDLLAYSGSNVSVAANLANKDRPNFYRMLRKHQIDKDTLTP